MDELFSDLTAEKAYRAWQRESREINRLREEEAVREKRKNAAFERLKELGLVSETGEIMLMTDENGQVVSR